MGNCMGVDWLKANDPSYVSPQKKAAHTRTIPVDPERLGEMMAGASTVKVGGTWVQRTPIGFAGDGEDSFVAEVIDHTTSPDRIVTLAQTHVARAAHSRNRTKAQKRRARRRGR